MELTDEQVAGMSPSQFLSHHGLNRDDILGDGNTVQWHLEHYGVKGMHWGITNEQQSDGSSGPPKLYKAYRRSKPAVVAVGMGAAFVTSGAVGMTFPVSAPVVLAAGFVGGAVAENIFARTGKMKIKEIK